MMRAKLRKIPLPMAGLILGLVALGNLVRGYGQLYSYVLAGTAGVFFLIYSLKLMVSPQTVKEELANPAVAGVFPTYTMALMLLATYIKAWAPGWGLGLWWLGIALHLALLLWFTVKFTWQFNIKQVFPSWFVVYVGIGVVGVTAPAFSQEAIGKAAFWLALLTYLPLLAVVLFRLIRVKGIPEPAAPTLAILAAPASLCLTAYLNSFAEIKLGMVYLLMVMSLGFYFFVLVKLPLLLQLKFYPSFSAFTFPFVISATSMQLANQMFLGNGQAFPLLQLGMHFQELMAVGLTLYVLVRYLGWLGQIMAMTEGASSLQAAP